MKELKDITIATKWETASGLKTIDFSRIPPLGMLVACDVNNASITLLNTTVGEYSTAYVRMNLCADQGVEPGHKIDVLLSGGITACRSPMCDAKDILGFYIPANQLPAITILPQPNNAGLDFESVTDSGLIRFNVTRSLPPSSLIEFNVSGFRNPIRRPGSLSEVQKINVLFGSDLGVYGQTLLPPGSLDGHQTQFVADASLLPNGVGAESSLSFAFSFPISFKLNASSRVVVIVDIEPGDLALKLHRADLSDFNIDGINSLYLAGGKSVNETQISFNISGSGFRSLALGSQIYVRYSGVQNPGAAIGESSNVVMRLSVDGIQTTAGCVVNATRLSGSASNTSSACNILRKKFRIAPGVIKVATLSMGTPYAGATSTLQVH
jgi:hypothetical protein